MRKNISFNIVILFMLLGLLSACNPQSPSVLAIKTLPGLSNTVIQSADTLLSPIETPIVTDTNVPTQVAFINQFIYDIPAMYEVTIKAVQFESISKPIQSLPMNIFYPPGNQTGHLLPVVILPNAFKRGGAWAALGPWGLLSNFESWGRMIAANGLVAVSYETVYPDDLDSLVKYLQDNSTDLGIDATRMGLFGVSSNGNLVGSYSNQTNREFIKFAVYFYGNVEFADSPWYQATVDASNQYDIIFAGLPKVTQARTDLPIFVVAVGNDSPDNIADMEFSIEKEKEQGVPLTYVYFEGANHGFDLKVNTSDAMREKGIKIIQQAIDFMIKNTSAT